MLNEQAVLDALRVIVDPDWGRDIVSLGFIKGLAIRDGCVSFTVELTTPACPVVGALAGVGSVEVVMSARQTQRPQGAQPSSLDTVNTIIAVSACKGGVGKSTVAVLLARALQSQGLAVGLLDADLYGPSLPTLLNVHQPEVYMEAGRLMPVEVRGLLTMSFGYLIGDAPAVMRGPMVSPIIWRGPMVMGVVNQVLQDVDWGELDYLIVDMPPGTGDIQLTITQRAKIDGAVIVTTPQALSLVDVAKGILMFEQVDVPVLGLVENMSHFVCDGCGKEHFIFGSSSDMLQRRFGLPTLALRRMRQGTFHLRFEF
ncbi:MAG: Mrp/NBP35 family ATP-binding protein [Candidatus Hydrogenedentes bacterium]|nr:Mrp/NBP35 family ATP-binding protein [Candidatus Hydrogenedentota bacterium]